MVSSNQLPLRLTFGPFTLDTSTGELLKGGTRIRLASQPFAILLVLLKQPGDVVTREQLISLIWPEGTFVDFDHGLNAAMNKLRRALSDSAEKPRYIETVPGRGYRFIGVLDAEAPQSTAPLSPAPVPSAGAKAATPRTFRMRLLWAAGGAACIVIGGLVVQAFHSLPAPAREWQFTRLTPDGEYADSPAVSRDGRLLAYSVNNVGLRDLYVKQIAGGESVRLTFDGADNTTPDFSPDGSKIVFRSGREGGGIFEIPALGGEARLLAHDGLNPKYSPDGTRVAFWVGNNEVIPTIPGNGAVWVIPSTGGRPVRAGAGLSTARRPIWSPDGKRLLVIGYAADKIWDTSSLDWWTLSIDGGADTRTGIRSALLSHGLEAPGNDDYPGINIKHTLDLPDPGCWIGDEVVFSARIGDVRNLWSAEVLPSGKVAGAIRRLTAGPANQANESCGSNETLVFARKTFAGHVWSVPFDLNRGVPAGPAFQLGHQPSAYREGASLSADGRYVAFGSMESGVTNVCIREIPTGKEWRVAPSTFAQRFPVISPSGDRVLYSSYEGDQRILYAAGAGGVPEKLCEGCVRPTDWSSDGKKVLTFQGSPYRVTLIDIASREQKTLLADPSYSLLLAHFSPDQRWISFTARVQPNRAWIMIAPIGAGLPVPSDSWIKIWEEDDSQDAGIWSPDGNILYFTSKRDGHSCIWGQRLDPGSHRPVEGPFVAQHFHEQALHPLRLWSAAGGQIAAVLTDNASSVWVMSRQGAR